MSLRILHVIATVNPAAGGPVEGVKQITRINSGYGHRIEIATMDKPDDPWVRAFPQTVHALGPAYTHYDFAPRFLPWLKANRHHYDCVVVNGIWGYNCFGTWLGLRKSSVPYYVYTHGMLDPWFKYRYPLKHLKKWLFWPWAVYPALRDADGVMFTCEEERRLARDSFWLYDCNEIVVNYGTPGAPDQARDYASAFLEKHPGLRDKRRFVFLGRVHPKKGPDILIKAFAEVLATHDTTFAPAALSTGRGEAESACPGQQAPLSAFGHSDPLTSDGGPAASPPSPPFVLIMAGPADGDYAAELKALATRLGIADRIYWTGMLLGEDKWGALQCAEAFLLPSHQENFGIAVAESLSVGVPVLISKSVNIWSDIVAEGAGLADEDTVKGAVRLFGLWLRMTDGERATMAAAAKACFLRRYTSRRAAISLLSNIYQAMHVKARGGTPRV